MWSINDEHVGPFDQTLKNLLSAWRFQIERHATLIAIGQVPGISIFRLWLRWDLVPYSPELASGWLHFNDIRAEVRQVTAAPGPAMKLAKSTTFNPEKMLSFAI